MSIINNIRVVFMRSASYFLSIFVLIISFQNNVFSSELTYPLNYKEYYATTKYRSAEVRNGPGTKHDFVGYLPGAERITIVDENEIDGWIQFKINWADKRKTWIKRKNIAMFKDYRPFTGNWPLRYLRFDDGHGDSSIWTFSSNNSCTENFINKENIQIAKEHNLSVQDIQCQELWEVPGSNLIFANPFDGLIDIWYDRKKNGIYVNSIIGDETGSLVYGYKTGLSKKVIKNCEKGRSIACKIYEEIKPSSKKDVKDPYLDASNYIPK